MSRRADQPIPSFAQMEPGEEAFFESRQGEDGTPVVVDAPAREPEPDLSPAEPELDVAPAVEPLPDTSLPSEDDLELPIAVDAERKPAQAPIAAVQAERARRQAAEKRLAEKDLELGQHREWRARIDERLRVLNEQRARSEQVAPPDPMEDPEGHRNWQDQQREARIEQLEKRLAATEHGGEQNQLMASVASMTQNFAAQNPDYHATVQALRAKLDEEYQAAFYDDPNERAFMINAWTDALVRKAISKNQNPAEAVYRIAKSRIPNAGAPPALDREVAPPGNAARVEGVRRGQAATRSLSRGGGRDVSDGLTLDKLLTANPVEFARYCKEQPRLVDALMGRGGH